MTTLRDRRRRRDGYYRRARREGYASRAVYKLQEIDRRFQVLQPGQRVVDFGCWPGSWLQYAARRVGSRGKVVGYDLQAITEQMPPWVETRVADVFHLEPEGILDALGGPADVVLSDAAPHTTGIRLTDAARSAELVRRILELASQILLPGGWLVAKAFQGEGFDELLLQTKDAFTKTRCIRPKGSRQGSMEIYLIGRKRQAPAER